MIFGFFFFKQKTAYEMRISDWSSDVCSSDLNAEMDEDIALGLVAHKEAESARRVEPFHGSGQPGEDIGPVIDERRCIDAGRVVRKHVPQIGRASCRERVCQDG